jgi:hypothetical protein
VLVEGPKNQGSAGKGWCSEVPEKQQRTYFKTGAFNRSATHPSQQFQMVVPSSLATNRELQPDCNRQRNYQRSRGIPNRPPIAFAAAASAPLNKCP